MKLPPRYKLLSDPSSTFNVTKSGHLYELESVNHKGYQPDQLEGIKRNQITTFSKDSRRRMIKRVSAFGERCPIFGTTTYDDPMPTVKEAKRDNHTFMRRMLRKYPGHWIVWRMEFQPKSGRPHFHYLIYGQEKTPFVPHQWFRENWRSVTGRDSLWPEVKGMRSHRGGIYYASKYLCKEDEEGFQKYKDYHPGTKVGRFWGIAGRENIPDDSSDTAISTEDYKWLLLHMVKDKAERSMKRDLRKQGKTWDEIDAEWGSPNWDQRVMHLARRLWKQNGMPTWTCNDETNFLDRTIRLSKNSNSHADIDYVFRFC